MINSIQRFELLAIFFPCGCVDNYRRALGNTGKFYTHNNQVCDYVGDCKYNMKESQEAADAAR